MPDQQLNSTLKARLNVLESVVSNPSVKERLVTSFAAKDGNWAGVLKDLREAQVPEAMISKIDFTHSLGDITGDNQKLISKISALPNVENLRSFALNHDTQSIAGLLAEDEIPESVKGATTDEKKLNYAKLINTKLFAAVPSAVVNRMIDNGKLQLNAGVSTFLSDNPDFDMKRTSVYDFLKNEDNLKNIPADSKPTVVSELKTLQRITAVSPVPEAVPVLYNANLKTAFQISEMPPAQFKMVMKDSGLDEATVDGIHSMSQAVRVRGEHALMALKEISQPTGIALVDKSMIMDAENDGSEEKKLSGWSKSVNDKLQEHNLSWDMLFGDVDMCECDDCTSVYSAASYFVELLQYLRNNDLDASETGVLKIKGPKDISGTPVEKLFKRRPDLGCLELTCANTNTILPYVDLVNEVMENYVAFKKLVPFNVDDETSSELLAEPQHTEYQAYCILKNEVYPFTLPYHQPIDAARIYLKSLGTSRYELIKTFRKNNAGDDAELTKLQDEVIDRAKDAEFLNITKEEFIILTRESFESKALFDKVDHASYTDQVYQEKIGVKPIPKYFGYDDEGAMLADDGLRMIKKEFLRRTGIDYFNLVDLLKTEFINPCLPKGKSKAILESIHFSYRFLQQYAKVFGLKQMADDLVNSDKIVDLFKELKGNLSLLTGKNQNSCPNPSGDTIEITDKDVIHWVTCHFEKVGRMIVIETGKDCINGRIYLKVEQDKVRRPVAIVQDCKIYTPGVQVKTIALLETNVQGWNEIGTVDKETGKITLSAVNNAGGLGNTTNFIFEGAKGEQGAFIVLNNDMYLILEQRDTCNLDTAILQHLDGSAVTKEEYDRMQRFIRLWRKMGWTIDETDKAIKGLSVKKEATVAGVPATAPQPVIDTTPDDCADGNCDDCEDCRDEDTTSYDINVLLLHQLVAVKKIMDKTGLDLIRLLSFWSSISTAGENSLYKKLFLKHNVVGIDSVFKADPTGNYLVSPTAISTHLPVVMASLNLSADDIQSIRAALGMDDQLTLDNLSTLYRYRLLSKALGLKIPDFLKVVTLFGDPFTDARSSYRFLRNWEKMEDAGFTWQQLNFIVKGLDDPKKPFTPAQKTVLILAKTLYDGLNGIEADNKDVTPDPAITDPELQQLDIISKASNAFVRNKASLLFDSAGVESISGYLEGMLTYSTNAPLNLTITIPTDKSLSKKLTYGTDGTLKITGILTDAESIDFKALSNDPGWAPALTRIEKQQAKRFKELFSGIASDPSALTADEKALQDIIRAGDITIAVDQLPPGPDPNTAPGKRVAFLKLFMPYLRRELSHRFIVSTLSGYTGLSNEITDLLLTSVLALQPGKNLYSVFEQIKENSSAAPASGFSGYLNVTGKGAYTFIVKKSVAKPVLNVDGQPIDFQQQEDPTDEWWSTAPLNFDAGKLYKLDTGTSAKDLYWKTASSSALSIPASSLIPDYASSACTPALVSLKKAALLISGFTLGADEISFLAASAADFDAIDFNAISLQHWLRLEAYTRLRNSLPQTELNILDFWKWTRDPASDATKLAEKIAALTLWKKERIQQLISAGHFNLLKTSDFRNEKSLLKVQKALQVADKISVDIDLLFEWAVPSSKFKVCRGIADAIRSAMRSKYSQDDWEQFIKPLEDQLRNDQKAALIAYLLQQPELINWGVEDADGLFEYFLIDVQMDACMQTSRIKQAISSVQLFIQRCFLGLEKEHSSIGPEVLDRKRWEWMQRYRVWEANRKVFLYPENWIESNLRDDKTPFFKEMEGELLQKDINKQNVTDALKSYLYKTDEVAKMQIIGIFIEGTVDSNKWSENARLHIFGRTRNAPYFFYYRYLALDEMNWYPWEKMQVDIPNYDVENSEGVVVDNGSYLTPVVWNQRLLVFFPQIARKTKSGAPKKGKIADFGNDPSGLDNSTPFEYYEVKMAWSEYRNGKWTQKQVSKDVVASDPRDNTNDLQFFKFVPIIYPDKVVIDFDDNLDADGGYKGGFLFDGSKVETTTQVGTGPMPIDYFNQDAGNMYSWQLDSTALSTRNTAIAISEDSSNEVLQGIGYSPVKFSHPFSHELLGQINSKELSQFFQYNLQVTDMDNAFGFYDPDNMTSTDNAIFHELKKPYSLYVWETFFHTPMMLADALSKAQQFEEAMKWYHFVFDPTATGTDDKRYWQFKPFRQINAYRVLDSIFNNLQPDTADKTISEWRDKPFMPHLVARNRPVAYMKWVVMKYIDNLVAWGDYLFRQDTIETINQATQLYVLAGHILGPRPMVIPKRGKIQPQTYMSLLDKWDAFGNAMTELELAAPFSNQIDLPFGVINGQIAFANIFGLASSLYFGIPSNPKLTGYWDTIEDRLYKIRNCENIEGVFRMLPLFEPPIDPALLVSAAAQGLSIASVLNDLNTPLPNYRFYYLLQKALELCGELKSTGNALLSAMEKKDNEALSLLRAKHETAMQGLIMEIKKKQLEDAQATLQTLEQNRKAPEHRMRYYLQLVGEDISKIPGMDADFSEIAESIEAPLDESGLKLMRYEKEDMDKASAAADWQIGIGVVETLASVFHALPTINAHGTPLGVGVAMSWGFPNLANATSAVARGLKIYGDHLTYQSSSAGKKGGFLRALQERIFQANAAGYEVKQIDKQITAQKIRIEIANLELNNQQKQIDNAQEVEDFLTSKYSSEELYTWMRSNLKTLYYQIYTLAYDLAKKAEKVYRFERGLSSSNFIQFGYWEASRDGLLSGERLYVGIKQLEAAYQQERGYDYELTKVVSLRQVDPLALLELKEKGACEFRLPEILFDMDYPGHYRRRIKSVSLSIPCIAGPYTNVNASLRLLENKIRISSLAKDAGDYAEKTEEEDTRFITVNVPIASMAATNGLNDSGLFELNFKDERYLPFEGAGVVSKWRLEFPAQFRQFDYNSITDAVIHIRYTSMDGGERLKKSASDALKTYIKSVDDLSAREGLFTIVDLKHDFANEWYKAFSNGHTMDLGNLNDRLPVFTRGFDAKKIKATDIYIAAPSVVKGEDVTVMQKDSELAGFDGGTKVDEALSVYHATPDATLDSWSLKFTETLPEPDRMWMIVRYTLS